MASALDTAAATERIVAEVARADDSQRTDLATNGDLADLRADLTAAIAALEVRLLKWGIGFGLAIAGLLFAALRLTG